MYQEGSGQTRRCLDRVPHDRVLPVSNHETVQTRTMVALALALHKNRLQLRRSHFGLFVHQ